MTILRTVLVFLPTLLLLEINAQERGGERERPNVEAGGKYPIYFLRFTKVGTLYHNLR